MYDPRGGASRPIANMDNALYIALFGFVLIALAGNLAIKQFCRCGQLAIVANRGRNDGVIIRLVHIEKMKGR